MSPKATRRDIEAARTLVKARDQGRCQMCGKWVEGQLKSVHHRLNRGRGGSALLERASILVTLCGTGVFGCHGWIGREPTAAGLEGWLLPRNNPDIDPTQEPLHTYQGWRLLDDEGGWSPCESPLLEVRP
jgi:hypothetical protein